MLGLEEKVWWLTIGPRGPEPILVMGVRLRPKLQRPRQLLTACFTASVRLGLLAALTVEVSGNPGRLKVESPVRCVIGLFLLLIVIRRSPLVECRKLWTSVATRDRSETPAVNSMTLFIGQECRRLCTE